MNTELEYISMLDSLWTAQASIKSAQKSFLLLKLSGVEIDTTEIAQAILEIVSSIDNIVAGPEMSKECGLRKEAVDELLKKINN